MLGKRVKYYRLMKGLTQEELAKRVGTAQECISNIERGKDRNPTLRTVEKLARALGVKIENLLGDSGDLDWSWSVDNLKEGVGNE